MRNFRHVARAPALASSTPDPSCTTDLVFRFQVGAGRDQGLGDFQFVVVRCLMKRGLAVLSWKEQVGAHGREGTKEGVSYEQLSPVRHVAPAPALASSTPDRSCTTDLVFRFQVGAGRDQGLGSFRCLHDHERGSAVLS